MSVFALPATRLRLPPHVRRPAPDRGQSLVEFALILPLFVTMMLAVVEFAFVFNAVLGVNYASRNAALLAAEGGNELHSDCVILRSVERDLQGPTDPARVLRVEIYRADESGAVIGSPTIYLRGAATTTCSYADGTVIEVPYGRSSNGYPEASRCNWLAGCGPGSSGPDLVGVRVAYHHTWVTPLRSFVGGNPGGLSFDRSNVMRMEPVL